MLRRPRSQTEARLDDIRPSLDELRQRVAHLDPCVRSIPVHRELLADLETPVSVYLKVTNGLQRSGFLLESVEGGMRIARYSFIGADPVSSIVLNNGVVEVSGPGGVDSYPYSDPLDALRDQLSPFHSVTDTHLPRFTGGAVGYLAYDAISRFEPTVPLAAGQGLGLPEAQFHIADSLVVFDHLERSLKLTAHVQISPDVSLDAAYSRAVERIDELTGKLEQQTPAYAMNPASDRRSVAERFRPNTSTERYRNMVERARDYIFEGDIFQVVPSQRVDITTDAHPFTMYRALRVINPSPYMFYLDFGQHQVVGASPELLVRLEDGVVTNHPIAGTRPRGSTPNEDIQHAVDLLGDEKERSEHVMLLDLGRNDVGRVAKPGSVRVSRQMEIERFSHVMHLVSHVEGELDPSFDGLSALRACFPAGTVSGAPKIRAMEIIAEMEADRRGVYSGAVGYVDFSGGMDTCIALRTLVYQNGVASLQAGGGVVAESVPETEYAESMHKMRALVRAIERAEQIEHYDLQSRTGDTNDDLVD